MKRFLAWLNVVVTLATIAINVLANALPFNGKNTGAISDQFRVYFVPAGYVFAIWGVIYIGWIAFTIYQALPAQRDNPRLNRIGYLYAWSGVANSVWLFFWHYERFPLTVLVMLTLLILLVTIYLRLNINRERVATVEKWCVDIPFSIYLGWISVATIANITDLLYAWQWNGFGIDPQAWAVIMLVVASLLSLAVALMRADIGFLLVIVWAFVGIGVKQSAAPLVANTAYGLAVLVALMIGLGWWYRGRTRGLAAT